MKTTVENDVMLFVTTTNGTNTQFNIYKFKLVIKFQDITQTATNFIVNPSPVKTLEPRLCAESRSAQKMVVNACSDPFSQEL